MSSTSSSLFGYGLFAIACALSSCIHHEDRIFSHNMAVRSNNDTSDALQTNEEKIIRSRPSFYLEQKELELLIKKATDGDNKALWRVYTHYIMDGQLHEADKWLMRGVKVGMPNAIRSLAIDIESGRKDYHSYGRTREEAVVSLLEQAAVVSPAAAYDLALTYGFGSFGKIDLDKAAFWALNAARRGEHRAGIALAKYLANGATINNDVEEYYYCSVATRVVVPSSDAWIIIMRKRENLSSRLTIADLERTWERVDDYILRFRSDETKRAHDNTYLLKWGDEITKEIEKLVDEREREYRNELRKVKRKGVTH